MKKWGYLLGAAALAFVFVITLYGRVETHAISGCCKERSSYTGNWYKNGKTFAQCQQANQRDDDNIFQQQGLVWWDVNCQ
jgi:hypothetical protein